MRIALEELNQSRTKIRCRSSVLELDQAFPLQQLMDVRRASEEL